VAVRGEPQHVDSGEVTWKNDVGRGQKVEGRKVEAGVGWVELAALCKCVLARLDFLEDEFAPEGAVGQLHDAGHFVTFNFER
jgi:hypothetical protein